MVTTSSAPAIDGATLRAARERAWMTQAQLAEAFGVSERTVTYWEAKGVPAHRVQAVQDWLLAGQAPTTPTGPGRLATLHAMRANLLQTLALVDAQIAAEAARTDRAASAGS